MQNTIQDAKRALRDQVRAALQRIPAGERVAASVQARALLKVQAQWRNAQSVLFFAPLPEELEVWPLLSEALSDGKRVALPRFVAATRTYEACPIQDPTLDLQIGRFGIREPNSRCTRLASNRLDLILVPGVAFDLQGGRLGRGRGYYDRLLRQLHGTTCGVAFDQQVVEEIPRAPHDAPMNCILTPTRWVEMKA